MGSLKFLISRQDLASIHSSASSDSSSVHYNPSPTGISPSTGGPIYDEIMAPSGYQIGTPKCVCLRKVLFINSSEVVSLSIVYVHEYPSRSAGLHVHSVANHLQLQWNAKQYGIALDYVV